MSTLDFLEQTLGLGANFGGLRAQVSGREPLFVPADSTRTQRSPPCVFTCVTT